MFWYLPYLWVGGRLLDFAIVNWTTSESSLTRASMYDCVTQCYGIEIFNLDLGLRSELQSASSQF